MRRADREVSTMDEILGILRRCDTLRVAMNGEGAPYVVPVSFGCELAEGKIRLFFHGVGKGLKHELLERDPRVCVEAGRCLGFTGAGCEATCGYESVIGFGTARRVSGAEAVHGLDLLLDHCGLPGGPCDEAVLAATTVYKITLDSVSGKRKPV